MEGSESTSSGYDPAAKKEVILESRSIPGEAKESILLVPVPFG